LATHLGEIPDAEVVRPFGKSYHVVLVNNVVILPVEYAKTSPQPTTALKH
jgi:hypothetical protein